MEFDASRCFISRGYPLIETLRKCLATRIGVDLSLMEGYAPEGKAGQSWKTVSDDLAPLFFSETTGAALPAVLCSHECKGMALRLYELWKTWNDADVLHRREAFTLLEDAAHAAEIDSNLVIAVKRTPDGPHPPQGTNFSP